MPRAYPHLINPPTSRRPSHWAASKAVYLICFLLELSLSPLKHLLLMPNPSISLCFSPLPLHTHPPSVITQTTVQPAPQPAEFQTGPFWQKPRATVSTLCSSWILTNPAAVPSILLPLRPPKLLEIPLDVKQRGSVQVVTLSVPINRDTYYLLGGWQSESFYAWDMHRWSPNWEG